VTGCLTFPFKVLAFLLVVAGLAAGWWYREDIMRFGRRQLGVAEPPSPVGHPDPAALQSGRAAMDALVRTGADSVVLSPSELASLVADELGRSPAGVPESVTVELGEREVTIRARVATAPIPAAIRVVLGSALGERETIEVGGRIGLRRAGLGEFEIRRVRVRGFPVPRDLVERLVGRYLTRIEDGQVLFAVPEGITGIRVTPLGATLYGRGNR
jgi:hypothetical protein